MRVPPHTQRPLMPIHAFSLMELVIVLAIMGIIGSLALPLVSKKMDASRNTRTQADIQAIATGVNQFYQDLGRAPDRNAAGQLLQLMISAGTPPADSAGSTWFGGALVQPC